MKDALARLYYDTYTAAVGGQAWNGDPLPDWDTFVADPNKQVQVEAWRRVAETFKVIVPDPRAILVVTVPSRMPLGDSSYVRQMTLLFRKLVPAGVRVLLKHDDMNVDVLADLLTPADLARMAARQERRALTAPPPRQRSNTQALTP